MELSFFGTKEYYVEISNHLGVKKVVKCKLLSAVAKKTDTRITGFLVNLDCGIQCDWAQLLSDQDRLEDVFNSQPVA